MESVSSIIGKTFPSTLDNEISIALHVEAVFKYI